MVLVPTSFDLNLELGRAVEAIERILARRDKAKRDYWFKLEDDLEAAALIAHEHHSLYGKVVGALQHAVPLTARSQARKRAINDASAFVNDAELLSRFIRVNARIEAASHDRRRLASRVRAAAKALRDAADAGERYIKYMESLQDGTPDLDASGRQRWNLSDLRAAIDGGRPDDLSLEDISDKVARAQYLTKLKYQVERTGGAASQKIRMRQRH